jgi:hypothetical protein
MSSPPRSDPHGMAALTREASGESVSRLTIVRHCGIFYTEVKVMQFLTIREFSKSPKAALSKLARDGKAVLTNNGKPTALMLNVDAENFERVFLFLRQAETAKNVNKLEKAAILAHEDYRTDKELTVFAALDGEPFYETR